MHVNIATSPTDPPSHYHGFMEIFTTSATGNIRHLRHAITFHNLQFIREAEFSLCRRYAAGRVCARAFALSYPCQILAVTFFHLPKFNEQLRTDKQSQIRGIEPRTVKRSIVSLYAISDLGFGTALCLTAGTYVGRFGRSGLAHIVISLSGDVES